MVEGGRRQNNRDPLGVRNPNEAMNMHKKPYLPEKDCLTCGRPFRWRKKWARDWENVMYCSERCKRNKPIRNPS